MTTPQRIILMSEWWPNACAAQGWSPKDRNLRLRVLSAAVGREMDSASDLDSTGDIDAVKAHLLTLAERVSNDRESDGQARRFRAVIGDLLKCLSLYHPNPRAYLQVIIDGKAPQFRPGQVDRVTLDDLTAELQPGQSRSPLEQVLYALSRTVDSKRSQAKDSVHAMKLRAGVRCNCKLCVSQPAAVPSEMCPF